MRCYFPGIIIIIIIILNLKSSLFCGVNISVQKNWVSSYSPPSHLPRNVHIWPASPSYWVRASLLNKNQERKESKDCGA